MKSIFLFLSCLFCAFSLSAKALDDDWGDWGLESKPLPKTTSQTKYSVGIDGDDENLLNLIDQSSLNDEDFQTDVTPDIPAPDPDLNIDVEPL